MRIEIPDEDGPALLDILTKTGSENGSRLRAIIGPQVPKCPVVEPDSGFPCQQPMAHGGNHSNYRQDPYRLMHWQEPTRVEAVHAL